MNEIPTENSQLNIVQEKSLLERSTEVLPSYSFSHALLSLGGMLNSFGLSSVKICTLLPYFAGKQGCSQKQPRFREVTFSFKASR